MSTRNALDTVSQLIEAINGGNLEAALALYEPKASLVAEPGKVARGTAALREALAGFIALKPTLTSEQHQMVEAGDVVLYLSRWSLRGTGPDGNEVKMAGRSSDVLRRQPDGTWLIAIDNPWGTDILGK
jgi:ketosteroid isomerase-like protein